MKDKEKREFGPSQSTLNAVRESIDPSNKKEATKVIYVWDDNRDESQFLTNQERDDWDDFEPNSWGY
tara:strand:+ start:955 stop:1155 length:201 start_codon:yes stop_codon:yes gene_type:complete